MIVYLRGGPMDGHAVNTDDGVGVTITIEEQPAFCTALAIGKLIPIKPTTRVAHLEGRRGIYELREDGNYYWRGWSSDE